MVRESQSSLQICQSLWGVGGLAYVSVCALVSFCCECSDVGWTSLRQNYEIYLSCPQPTSHTFPALHSIIHMPNLPLL